jgi:hypothetical protein
MFYQFILHLSVAFNYHPFLNVIILDFLKLHFKFQFLQYCSTSSIFFYKPQLIEDANYLHIIIQVFVIYLSPGNVPVPSVSKYSVTSFIKILYKYGLRPQTWGTPFWVAQIDIRFSQHFTKNFISWYIIFIELPILSLTPIFLIWKYTATLLLESNAFSKSTKHQYNLSRFALKYLSTDVLIIKILPTVLLPFVNRVWKDVNFCTILTNLSIYELLFLKIFSPKLVAIKYIPLNLDLAEDGDLIFET